METGQSAITIDFRDPAYRHDPYPYLARLRQHDPVHFSELGIWIITRHADVDALNRDHRLGRDIKRWHGYPILRPYLADSTLEQCVENWMFFLDPPEHTRLRRLVSYAFTPRVVHQMKADIAAIADELLDEVEGETAVDLMSFFAQPFPVRVIARILDLPIHDFAQLKAWSDALARVVEPTFPRKYKEAANTATAEMEAYLRARIAERRQSPGDDLLGQLIAVEEMGDRLTEAELVSQLVLMFIAGHETTTNLIGNGLFALLRHPDQMSRLRNDLSLLPTAVEEFLRYDSPATLTIRVPLEDIHLDGKTIEAGQLVMGMLAAANRDPLVFENPDQLDIGRNPNPHVSFGGGVHYCLGAPLARLEAQIAFERILQRWSSIEVDESQVQWRDFINLRGLERLPLMVRPRSKR